MKSFFFLNYYLWTIEIIELYITQVSQLGFGCMGLSGHYNDPVAQEVGISIINRGITIFDTSEIYGYENANEVLVKY